MKKLIIKIGDDLKNELKLAYLNPKLYAKPNTHTIYLKDSKELYKLFSPQRMELLRFIINNSSNEISINYLSKKLKRKQEAISRDTIMLEKYQLIKKIKEKQEVHIKAIYNSLLIDLSTKNTI